MVGSVTESVINQRIKRDAQAIGLQVQCLASGDPNSEIAIIAEAPGDRECELKMPQVGSGGRLLWDVLRPHGINRTSVWTTNVVKRQLLSKDDEKLHITNNELDHWHSLLRLELSMLPNLKYIVVLGNMALDFFVGSAGILKWRGSVIDWNDKKLIISVNPALPIREPKWDIVFRFDMAKLKKVLDGRWKPHPIEYHINPSPTEAVRWIQRMGSEGLPVSFDIETIAGETACIGLANNPHSGMCINFRSKNGHHYNHYEECFVRREFARLFSNRKVEFVAQNGPFDCNWLWFKDKIRVWRVWYDTLLAHHTLYPPLPHSLAFLTAQYTTLPYYKDDKEGWYEGGDIDEFWRYNIKDVCATRKVQIASQMELRAQGLEDFFFNHVMMLQPELIKMTQLGVKADVELKQHTVDTLREDLANRLTSFHQAVANATGDEEYKPNPKSPKQLAELFFVRLRLVGRGASTDDENRTRMRNHVRTNNASKHVIDECNGYIEQHKFVTTYAEMELDADERFRCEYKQFGVASAPGRLSSSQTAWGTGGNLQNIPERAKPMFVAERGRRLVYFDLSQAEARCVAYFADISKWKEQFERARLDGSYDCHRALASEMFDIAYEAVPSEDRDQDGKPTIRFIAKRCRHGLNYRMGPDRLATVTGLPINRAIEAYNLYHRITPELRRWWDDIIKEVRDTKQLFNSLGRRWRLLERFDERALESVVAFKPQSTIGDKVGRVIYQSHNDREWRQDHFIILNIHDALIADVPDTDDDAIHALRIMTKYAEEPIIIKGQSLIVPADVAWSKPDASGIHRWSTITKIKDKDILKQIKSVA